MLEGGMWLPDPNLLYLNNKTDISLSLPRGLTLPTLQDLDP